MMTVEYIVVGVWFMTVLVTTLPNNIVKVCMVYSTLHGDIKIDDKVLVRKYCIPQ